MTIDVQSVKSAAQNRWLSIFDSLGIEIPIPPGSHGPCPVCRGTDRFRLDSDTSDGTWFCNQCTPQSGDGISLVRQCLELSFPDTITEISKIIGIGQAKPDETRTKQDYDPKKSLNNLWLSSRPLEGGDPVSKYLHARGLMLTPDNVRYCLGCWCSETKAKRPAMVAMFHNPKGKAVSIHRTYLDGDKKADIKSPRKLMKGTEHLSGGAIRLFKPQNNTLGIAEGIETAIAAKQITQIPTWAAVSSTLLKAFQPPDDVKRLVIFADADANFCGQQAAYTLANRLIQTDRIIEVELPEMGKDFNDCLMELRERGAYETLPAQNRRVHMR